jgi:CubicO group peptidase (beta-lactamase class C family)
MLESAVDARNIGSAVALIARDDDIVYLEAVGEAAPGVPMFEDAIMRLASVGKAFTAVAAMILYERGVLELDDPVSKFIPAFAEAKVAVDGSDGGSALVDPARPTTVRDLLTHTGGLSVASDEFEEAWQATEATTTRDLAERIARTPMPAHPGETYEYGYYGSHYEVLAAVIEAASGQTLEAFLNENVFGPLGMNDSYFWVPEAKVDRLTAIYKLRGEPLSIDRARGDETERTTFFSGGGGVRSTVRDVFRFGQMILNGGALEGVRILSPKTVDLMSTDHVGDLMTWGGGEYGWGFGFAVRRRVRDYGIGSVGTLGWTGGSGAQWWVDPEEGLVAVLVTPFAPPPYWPVHERFERMMYAAVTESRASRQ